MTGTYDPSQQREFRCGHCNGRIVIPIDLPPTTGPCPHCGGVITSPAPPSRGLVPFTTTAVPAAPAIPVQPQAQPQPQPVPVPVPVPQPPPQVVTPVPAQQIAPAPPPSAPAQIPVTLAPPPALAPPVQVQLQPPLSAPPVQPQIVPPVQQPVAAPVQPAQPAAAPAKPAVVPDEAPPVSQPKTASLPKGSRRGLIPALLVMLVLIGILGAGAIYFLDTYYGKTTPPLGQVSANPGETPRPNNEEEYLRTGWQREAYKVLRGYVDATTPDAKAPYIVGGKQEVPKLNEFYGGSRIDDSDTLAEAFSAYELSMEDRKRGLFLMIYDQPPQFEMREFFRPLASLEVQYGLQDADMLLASVAQASNFAMEPVRVQAFFKRFPDGLRLDWDMFAQTKYRSLRSFVESASPGQKAVFRVFVVEDVGEEGKSSSGIRTYRIADPATTSDSARIRVKVDSEPGHALSSINWRGTKDSRPQTRTATVELEWVGTDDPQLTISRFICWEFLGLGGHEGEQASSK